ncbi:MAG: tRNA (adenosine(37)-N6)-dimethylallyltransferase MiaA, partial [Staphylococcus sp.]|nr:tRNA (adenosine(37)-N6)-dimethylallyltransferase MiaA [Staphylococcus sp.]
AKRQLTWFKNKLTVQWFNRETMSLQMMLDEITTQINKRSSKHDCKPQHPRSSTREL